MKILLTKLGSRIPFLDLGDRLQLGAPEGAGGELAAGADLSGIHREGAALEGLDLGELRLYRARLRRLQLKDVDLTRSRMTHVDLREAELSRVHLTGASLTVVDASGWKLTDCSLSGASLVAVAARDGQWVGVDLSGAALRLCDLFGSRWRQVDAQGAHLAGVDLSWSELEGVDLRGADLRGSDLSFSTWARVDVTGAMLQDTDLRGVKGLTAEQRSAARAQGARLATDLIEELLGRALARVWSTTPEHLDAAARAGSRALQGGIALALLGITTLLFVDKLGEDPPVAVTSDAPEQVREVTDEETQRTREHLAQLRQALQQAYDVSGRYGVATWPSLADVANNEYDRDGAGPGTEKVPLVEGGLPTNLLTAGEGVLPYCNDQARQETLSGDDSDWHYCEETGRIFACGGYTRVPTVEW